MSNQRILEGYFDNKDNNDNNDNNDNKDDRIIKETKIITQPS